MKKYFILILLLLIPFVSGEVQTFGTFKQGTNIELLQLCGNCTYNNITLVTYPNSSVAISNVAMTKIGSRYNYTLTSQYTNALGKYIINGLGDPNGIETVWSYDLDITPSGKTLKEGESNINIWISISVFLIGFIFLGVGLFMMKGILKLIMFALGGVFALAGVMINVLMVQSYVSTNLELSTGYGSLFYMLAYILIGLTIVGVFLIVAKTVSNMRNFSRYFEE